MHEVLTAPAQGCTHVEIQVWLLAPGTPELAGEETGASLGPFGSQSSWKNKRESPHLREQRQRSATEGHPPPDLCMLAHPLLYFCPFSC